MINTKNEMNLEYPPDKITMDKFYYFPKRFVESFITDFIKKHTLRLIINNKL